LLLPLHIQKLKGFQLQGGFAKLRPPDPLIRGSALDPEARAAALAMPGAQAPPPKHDTLASPLTVKQAYKFENAVVWRQ